MATPKTSNRGLKVTLTFWPMDQYDYIKDGDMHFFIKGEMKNEQTGEQEKFNDAGKLLTQLGKWHKVQTRTVRAAKKAS